MRLRGVEMSPDSGSTLPRYPEPGPFPFGLYAYVCPFLLTLVILSSFIIYLL